MDKHYMKLVFAGHGLPVGPFVVISDRQWQQDPAAAMDAVASLGWPVFVKPARAGSSMGITKVDRAAGPAGRHRGRARARPQGRRRGRDRGSRDRVRRAAGPRRRRPAHQRARVRSRWSGRTTSTTSRPSTSPRPTCSCPARPTCRRRPPPRYAAWPLPRSRRSGCEGLARVDFFVHRERRGGPQRDQHDARVHAALDVPADVGRLGPGLPRADRRADPAGPAAADRPALRAARARPATSRDRRGLSCSAGCPAGSPRPPWRTPAAAAARGRTPRAPAPRWPVNGRRW